VETAVDPEVDLEVDLVLAMAMATVLDLALATDSGMAMDLVPVVHYN
jgi:hypothetical protein